MKPVVNYDEERGAVINVGGCAFVYPTNHPHCSNTKMVRTSKVLKHDKKTGTFETKNTVYCLLEE